MSKSRLNANGMGLVFFRLQGGRMRYESQRMLRTDRRGRTSLRGVIRIGTRPWDDARRVAVLMPYPQGAANIAELKRVFNQQVGAPSPLSLKTISLVGVPRAAMAPEVTGTTGDPASCGRTP